MYVRGFKAFNSDMTNRYGKSFSVGCVYLSENIVKFKKYGYHMCKNFEDTLRYFDAMNGQISICSVIGFGLIDKYSDEYNGYYDMYAVQKIYIERKLERDELLQMAKNLNSFRLERFVSMFRLSDDEIQFLEPYPLNVSDAIEYYQYGNKKVYAKRGNSNG